MTKVNDHPFKPSLSYPDGEGCSHIVEGSEWTIIDPICCRRPEREHVMEDETILNRKG